MWRIKRLSQSTKKKKNLNFWKNKIISWDNDLRKTKNETVYFSIYNFNNKYKT